MHLLLLVFKSIWSSTTKVSGMCERCVVCRKLCTPHLSLWITHPSVVTSSIEVAGHLCLVHLYCRRSTSQRYHDERVQKHKHLTTGTLPSSQCHQPGPPLVFLKQQSGASN